MSGVRPRSVLFICHNHPRVRPGGAETYAHEVHLAMCESPDWAPTFLARTGPPQSISAPPEPGAGRIRALGDAESEYLLHPQGQDFDWLFGTIRHDKSLFTRDLRDFLLAIRPDVVHFQHTLFIGYDAIREVRRTLPDAPIVCTLHDFLPICHNHGQMVRTMDGRLCEQESPHRCSECFPGVSPESFFLRKRFVQAQLGLVDLFIAPSAVLLERYVAWGIPRERILLEEYGRRGTTRASASPRAAPHDRLGFFGQLNPFKGIDVLLAAMAQLDPPPPHLFVHGANLDLQEHGFRDGVQRALDAAADRVTVRGPYVAERVGELMADVDWVVVPSVWWENSPLVIQEAFTHGRPVICSDIGGMAEKVANERNGLHFRAGDAGSLAATLRRAVGTPGLWERLAAGTEPAHAMRDHLAVLADAYETLIRSRARTAA